MSTAWHNRFLFSHHYLEELCQDADDRTEAAHLVDALRGWTGSWDDRTLSKLIGTQVGPTLVSLGFTYGEPAADEDPHRLRLYASYRKEQQLGVCYVAHREDVETELESTINGRHYAAEIVHALQEDELSWGLLTDGERWRLYHANELAPYETYLEIDLAPVLQGHGGGEAGDAAFLLHTLFRQSAFARTEDGACALDDHLATSQRAASRIEKHLSGCIEEVLRDLCQGFVERDGKATYTFEERDEVFRNATVLLYRMLFMLYAEARELLPRDEPTYVPVSLDALVEQAVDYVRGSGLPNPDGTELWQALSNLSSWISSGNDARQIPAYNGDLFDDSDKRYIHDQTITDKYLAPALVSLGSLEDEATETGARRIDYRDLSVRHLGSIYEGLLEYKLFIARERRVRRADGKGGYTFPKLSETRLKKGEEENVIEIGDVYFANSAGERKAMGAYYTPEYIVDYIVNQTVLRGLQERRASLEEKLPGWIADVAAAPPSDRARLQAVVDQKLVDFVEQEVLTFRVCDPAMGSGHFLVNTVHAMTNFIVETLNLTPWENPKIDCDPVLWRRRVAKRCLYGVDLNELAVELAKLSLWLTTVAQGKPLSFLDHHLRHGNSLIGTRLEDLIEVLSPEHVLSAAEGTGKDPASENGQLSMFDEYPAFRVPLMEALDLMRDISARLADAAEDVEAQAADYAQLRRELKPYRDLANLLTARHFGVEVDEARVRAIAYRFLDAESELSDEDLTLLHQANEVARDRHFFHWGLEFPEVFVKRILTALEEDVGFDAMIGNPPYLLLQPQNIEKHLLNYYRSFRVAQYKVDIYHLFIERIINLLVTNGYMSYISPSSFLTNNFTTKLRSYVLAHVKMKELLIIPDGVFEEASVDNVIFLFSREPTDSKREDQMVIFKIAKAGTEIERAKSMGHTKQKYLKRASGYLFNPVQDFPIWEKCDRCSQPLGRIARVKFGMQLRDRSNYPDDVVQGADESSLSSDYVPALTGRNVSRYIVEYDDLYAFFNQEARRGGCWDPSVHFAEEKLIIPQVGVVPAVGYDDELHCCLNTVFMLTLKDTTYSIKYILTLLNSRCIREYWRAKFYDHKQTFPKIKGTYLLELPIRHIQFTTLEARRERLAGDLINHHELGEYTALLSKVRALLIESNETLDFQHDATELEEYSDVVHDLLVYLARQMIELHKRRQTLRQQVDIFHYIDQGEPFLRLTDAFVLGESRRTDDEMDLEKIHHDIDGLRLTPNADGTWTLELQAKFRDPEQDWQEWIKEEDGYMIKRRWVPAYRLRMSDEKARFYRYVLPRLQDFDNARSFPGGYTRSTLKKIHLTRVPMMPDVDLSELTRLDRELTETKRKIRLTDDLIDQIVYKLYGLTEEEIAIVEGRA